MPFIYTKNEDDQVVGVFEVQQTTPAGHTMYEEPWLNFAPWWSFKVVRNGVGDYYNTGVPHPDDNDGLMMGDL